MCTEYSKGHHVSFRHCTPAQVIYTIACASFVITTPILYEDYVILRHVPLSHAGNWALFAQEN